MNLTRLFASNVIWRGGYLLTSVLVTVLMARYLQAYASGWLFYFISWLSFFFLFAALSIESSITYHAAGALVPRMQLLIVASGWTLLVSLLSWLGAYLHFREANEFATISQQVAMTVAFLSGNVMITFFTAFFYAERDFRTPNLIFIAANLFLLLCLGWAMQQHVTEWKGWRFVDLYFLMLPLQGLLLAGAYVWRVRRELRWQWPGLDVLRRIFSYSLLAFGANLFFFLTTRVDYWLIDQIVQDRAGLGNYIQASRLVQLFQLFPGILAATIFPLAASGYRQRMLETVLPLMRLVAAGYAVVCGLLLLTGWWLFPFVFGSSFSDMFGYFALLVPGLLALSLLSLISAYFGAVNKVWINLLGSLAGFVVILLLDLLLIPRWGIPAAAVSSSVGYLLCFWVGANYLKREAGAGWLSLLVPGKGDLQWLLSLLSQLKRK